MIPTKALSWAQNKGWPDDHVVKLTIWWLMEKGPGEWEVKDVAKGINVDSNKVSNQAHKLKLWGVATLRGNTIIFTEERFKELSDEQPSGRKRERSGHSDSGKGVERPASVSAKGAGKASTRRRSRKRADAVDPGEGDRGTDNRDKPPIGLV